MTKINYFGYNPAITANPLRPAMQNLKAFLKDESGNSIIDYCLITGAVSAAIIGPLQEIGQRLAAVFTLIAQALTL